MAKATPAARRMREVTVDEALALLRTQEVGRLAYVVDGKPRIVPLNFTVHQGAVTFRTSYGDLLEAIHQRDVVFEADHVDEAHRTGWSVIVQGLAEEIWRGEDLEIARRLPLRPWAPGERDHYVRIVSKRITGRVIV